MQPGPSLPLERPQPVLVPAAEAARIAESDPRGAEVDVRAMEADMAAQLEEAFRHPPEASEPSSAPPAEPPEPLRPARTEPGPSERSHESAFRSEGEEMDVDLFEEDLPALRGSQWDEEAPRGREPSSFEEPNPPAQYGREASIPMREAAPIPRQAPSPQHEPLHSPEPARPREPARAQSPSAAAAQRPGPSVLELRIPELRLPELRIPEARRPQPPQRATDDAAVDAPSHREDEENRARGRASPPPVIAVPPAAEAPERGGYEADQDRPPAQMPRQSQIPSFTQRMRRDPRLATVPQPAPDAAHPETEETAPPPQRQAAPARASASDPFASLEEEMASLLGRSPGSSNP